MKSSFLDSGEIVTVYYNFGKTNNDQRPKFLRAPFVMLKLGGQEYVMPTVGSSEPRDLSNILGQTIAAENEYYLGRQDFGFETDEQVVVNESEMGGFGSEGWKGVHAFGMI